jgi:hypothetical protein
VHAAVPELEEAAVAAAVAVVVLLLVAGAAAEQVLAQELSCGSRQVRSPNSVQQSLQAFESESSSHSSWRVAEYKAIAQVSIRETLQLHQWSICCAPPRVPRRLISGFVASVCSFFHFSVKRQKAESIR